jgi:hypothetical protein
VDSTVVLAVRRRAALVKVLLVGLRAGFLVVVAVAQLLFNSGTSAHRAAAADVNVLHSYT